MHAAQQSSINPVFATYAAQQLQEATGGVDRVFDNLRKIARGDDLTANGYDRLRATRVLYERGFGKVTKTQPQTQQASGHNDLQVGALREAPADNNRPVARLEQKLDDELGPPQAPIRLDEPGHIPEVPGCTPDLAREAQYYVLEITNYGAELASILAYIHDPDPEDTTIRPCHRITAGRMILDRVIGAVADLEQPLDHWHDPSLEPNWTNKNPAEIDSTVSLEEIIEADRFARQHVEDMRKELEAFQPREETGPCEECGDGYPCEYHMMAEELSSSDDEILTTARGMRNLKIFNDRLYFDEHGILRLHPPDHVDDS